MKCSLVPRLKLGEESLVTSAGEAFNFQHVIVHVINIGHSHFNNNCHVI